MSRTLRSKKLRAVLYRFANGKCQICGKQLGEDWHADHVVPWSVTKRTNVHEMQALCVHCNVVKGGKMEINLDNMRPGQKRAVLTITKRVAAGETHTSIVLPTRYGKSDVIRISALQMFADNTACGSIVLSPGGDLRNQIVRQTKIKDMCTRYGIPVGLAKRVHEWRHAENTPFANGVYLLSTTIQYANRNVDDVAQLINSRFYDTGLPVVVFVDETHMLSNKNKWGKSIAKFIKDNEGNDNGARIVLLTATADRADGVEIPGFKYIPGEKEDCVRTVRTNLGEQIQVDFYEGVKRKVKIVADEEVTFKEAWNEKPSPLCTLSRDCIDVKVREVLGQVVSSDNQCLSELTPSQARLVIGKAVRDRNVMREGVTRFVSELQRARELAPDLAGIVFTGHDEDSDSEANEHANLVRQMIEERSDFECVIATSKSEDDSVSNHLGRFEKGIGDVLIVKNAGGAGFDCARLKVLLDLSSVRTFSSTVQRLMRVATPYNKITNAVVITLADAVLSAIWERVVAENGGEWSEGEFKLIDSVLVDVPDVPTAEKRTWSIDGSMLSSYDDTLGNTGDMDFRDEVESLLDAFPVLITAYTKPMIADRLKNKSKTTVEVFNDDEVQDCQKEINATAKKIAGKRMDGIPYNQDVYRDTMKAVYGDLFREASITQSKIEAIVCLDTLRKLKAIITEMAESSGVLWH